MGETFEPGLYLELSFPEYLAIDAASSHLLAKFERSAAHARADMLAPDDPSQGMIVGTAFHSAILEPASFSKRFVIHPEINGARADKRTKAGKIAWAEHEDKNKDRETLSRKEYESALKAQAAAWAHPVASVLLGGKGSNELSVVWTDKETGERCKARPDRVTEFEGWTTIVDIKKTRDAQRWRFESDTARFRYHLQAATYLEALRRSFDDDIERRHVILAIEENNPWGIGVFELDDIALESGLSDFHSYLRSYHRAKESGEWPGYEPSVQTITIPKYLRR